MTDEKIKTVYDSDCSSLKYFTLTAKGQIFFVSNILLGFLLTGFSQGLFFLLVSGSFSLFVLFTIAREFAKQKRIFHLNNIQVEDKDILKTVGSFYGILWVLAMFVQIIGMILGW